MHVIKHVVNAFQQLSLPIKITLIVMLIIVGLLLFRQITNQKESAPTVTTSQVERGTLIKAISASGTITQSNRVTVSTNATGVVKRVVVQEGDHVVKGQTIAEILLDAAGEQKQLAAWASYTSAKTALENAKNSQYTLKADLFKTNQTFMTGAVEDELSTDDPTYIQEQSLWLAAEAKYKTLQATIDQAQANLSSSWLVYTQTSATITAPANGKVSGLSLSSGSVLSDSTTGVAAITVSNGNPHAVVNLTEIDVVSVKPGQPVTITMDAYANKTFTGKISTINTSGTVSSGVTTYPATITFDTPFEQAYPNMAINAKILTLVKPNVLLLPINAITTTDQGSTVTVQKEGKTEVVPIVIGDSNDTTTEIISGISESDVIVTGTTPLRTTNQSQSIASPFSSFSTRGGMGSGGAAIIRR